MKNLTFAANFIFTFHSHKNSDNLALMRSSVCSLKGWFVGLVSFCCLGVLARGKNYTPSIYRFNLCLICDKVAGPGARKGLQAPYMKAETTPKWLLRFEFIKTRVCQRCTDKRKRGLFGFSRLAVYGFFFGSVIFVSPASRSSHAGVGSVVVNSIVCCHSFSHVGSS